MKSVERVVTHVRCALQVYSRDCNGQHGGLAVGVLQGDGEV